MLGFLGVSQLEAFTHRTDVQVRDTTTKCDVIAVLTAYESIQARLIEVTEPPVPYLGTDRCIHHQLLSCAAIRAEV